MNEDIVTGSESLEMIKGIYHKLAAPNITKKVMATYARLCPGMEPYVLRAAALTGIHPEVLKEMKESGCLEVEIKPIDRKYIDAELNNFILYQRKLPTTRELHHAMFIHKYVQPHVDLRSFRKQLILQDYVWYKAGEHKYVVIERPAVTFERYRFLKQVLEYKGKEMPFYFVDDIVVDKDNDCFTVSDEFNYDAEDFPKRITYAVSEHGLIENEVNGFGVLQFKEFITSSLLPHLNRPSVVIFKNAKHHNEAFAEGEPSMYSSKTELSAWLTRNLVPHSAEMSKAELMNLINRCTNKHENTFVIDKLLEFHGHKVLRLPEDILHLSVTTFVFEMIKKSSKRSSSLQSLSDHLNNSYLPGIFEISFQLMSERFELELKLDERINSILENIDRQEYDEAEDSDVPIQC